MLKFVSCYRLIANFFFSHNFSSSNGKTKRPNIFRKLKNRHFSFWLVLAQNRTIDARIFLAKMCKNHSIIS